MMEESFADEGEDDVEAIMRLRRLQKLVEIMEEDEDKEEDDHKDQYMNEWYVNWLLMYERFRPLNYLALFAEIHFIKLLSHI